MAEPSVNTPLLYNTNNTQSQPPLQDHLSISIQDQLPINPVPNPLENPNPFDFLGLDGGFSVPSSSTADPFRNHTPRIQGVYEWLKIVIVLPITLVRLVLFGLALIVGYVVTLAALQGWKDRTNPMPRWRSRCMWVTRLCARCILFSFGYQWIRRKGRPAPREIAPIVVSNHVSYIDPIFFFYELIPTIVSSESHDSLPLVGTIIRAMQRKASCDRFPRVLLFPEGTTTNGRFLISFQLGAFIPGYPIQPVVVRYPYVHFDQSWGNISLLKLMFRMFTQFHNFMEVEYLPVVQPPQCQKENVSVFAERTARTIATALNVVQTSHSYGDMMLLMKAHELKQENPSRFMVELAHPDLAYRINTMEALEFLEKFLSMNPDNSGNVEFDDFLRAMRLKPCGLSKKIFAYVDCEKTGKITFRQFLLASTHVKKQPLFQRALESSFAKCIAEAHNHISKEEFGRAIRLVIPDADHNDVNELFTMFDTDSDGRISKHDFLNCLKRNPLLIALFSPFLQQEFVYTGNGLLEEMV